MTEFLDEFVLFLDSDDCSRMITTNSVLSSIFIRHKAAFQPKPKLSYFKQKFLKEWCGFRDRALLIKERLLCFLFSENAFILENSRLLQA